VRQSLAQGVPEPQRYALPTHLTLLKLLCLVTIVTPLNVRTLLTLPKPTNSNNPTTNLTIFLILVLTLTLNPSYTSQAPAARSLSVSQRGAIHVGSVVHGRHWHHEVWHVLSRRVQQAWLPLSRSKI
jgi:hypothetical protein